MVKTTLKVIAILLLSGLVSCRAGRVPTGTAPAVVNGSAAAYIEAYRDLAVNEMKRSGVPASITLAQGMLESDYGRSSLARMANNHFGIKCHNGWTGPTMRQHDDSRNECFRKYQRPEESFQDHSDFLRSGSRYSFLFNLNPEDYKAWAHGLKRAGYATNPDYANLIIRKIEENNLYLLDRGTIYVAAKPKESVQSMPAPVSTEAKISGPPSATGTTITFGDVMARTPRVMENNRVQYILVKDGETREKIENEFQLLKRDLARYNDLNEDFIPVAGQMLYIEPKKDKAETGKEFHTAEGGETMHMISQKYGIRLKSLLELNRMTESAEPVTGQKIWLQEIKPLN